MLFWTLSGRVRRILFVLLLVLVCIFAHNVLQSTTGHAWLSQPEGVQHDADGLMLFSSGEQSDASVMGQAASGSHHRRVNGRSAEGWTAAATTIDDMLDVVVRAEAAESQNRIPESGHDTFTSKLKDESGEGVVASAPTKNRASTLSQKVEQLRMQGKRPNAIGQQIWSSLLQWLSSSLASLSSGSSLSQPQLGDNTFAQNDGSFLEKNIEGMDSSDDSESADPQSNHQYENSAAASRRHQHTNGQEANGEADSFSDLAYKIHISPIADDAAHTADPQEGRGASRPGKMGKLRPDDLHDIDLLDNSLLTAQFSADKPSKPTFATEAEMVLRKTNLLTSKEYGQVHVVEAEPISRLVSSSLSYEDAVARAGDLKTTAEPPKVTVVQRGLHFVFIHYSTKANPLYLCAIEAALSKNPGSTAVVFASNVDSLLKMWQSATGDEDGKNKWKSRSNQKLSKDSEASSTKSPKEESRFPANGTLSLSSTSSSSSSSSSEAADTIIASGIFRTSKSNYRLAVLPFNYTESFKGTPLNKWYQTKKYTKSHWQQQNLANALRLAYLYKHGGIYMDLDLLTINPLPTQGASIAWQDGNLINNAYLQFPRAHPFLWKLMENFVKEFNGYRWAWQGPHLITRVYRGCRAKDLAECEDLQIHPSSLFYPVHYRERDIFYKSMSNPKVLELWKGAQERSITIHWWNRVLKESGKGYPSEGTFFHTLLNDSCPSFVTKFPLKKLKAISSKKGAKQ